MKALPKMAAIVALAMSVSVSAVYAETLKFIAVTNGQASDPFYNVVKNGINEAAAELGVEVEYRSPETFDMVAMGHLIDAAVNQSPDGLIVSIPDPDALGPSIRRAIQSGIPVISFDSGGNTIKELGGLMHLGQREYDAGVAAGKKLKELGGTKGICVHVEPGNVALDDRCKGFSDGFGGNVTILPTSLDLEENAAKIRAALDSDPQIDTVLGTSAPHAGETALDVLEKTERVGKVLLATFDLSPGVLEAVADRKIAFAVDQQQYLYAYLAVVLMNQYVKNGLLPALDVLPTGPNLVTADTAAQVIELSAKGIR